MLFRDYYFFSFGGLHFSQTLLSFLAATQQGWEQSLPAAFALSQQVSAYVAVTEKRAMTPASMSFVMFIGDKDYHRLRIGQGKFQTIFMPSRLRPTAFMPGHFDHSPGRLS